MMIYVIHSGSGKMHRAFFALADAEAARDLLNKVLGRKGEPQKYFVAGVEIE